jgi:methylmalonyl-CoA mutase cobalamin-binding domain/chain
MAMRRPRRSVVVAVGKADASETSARALTKSLSQLGIETIYLGREQSADRIATVAAEEEADAVEFCLAGGGAVMLLREILRALIEVGRRDVSIVLHRPK